jgi:hypothetical protein
MFLYGGAILVACAVAWKVALRSPPGTLEMWACLILAYDVGALALTFNYPLFIGQVGLEFWLLNAVLFAAALDLRRRLLAARRGPAVRDPLPPALRQRLAAP